MKIRLKQFARRMAALTIATAIATATAGAETIVDMTSYGLRPDTRGNMSPRLTKALADISRRYKGKGAVTLKFAPGRYSFHPKGSHVKELYISNHDQTNPKQVAFWIEGIDSLRIDGNGADFIFHGTMLPVAVSGSTHVTLRDFHIDFENPHIAQATIVKSDSTGIEFEVAPWVKAGHDKNGFFTTGEGWTERQRSGIAFEPETRRVVYRTADLYLPLDSVVPTGPRRYFAPRWRNRAMLPGMIVAMRSWARPTPGIFLADCTDIRISNVKVHYAQGMGLLAQMCRDITLEGFEVALRGDSDPRYFTTQADATHFSGCKGHISSTGGLYEGMMDDAINVHGTYLKVVGREGARTLRARYMHGQSYGFRWGEPGDTVQPIDAPVMEPYGNPLVIASIKPADTPDIAGAKEFDITFTTDIDTAITAAGGQFGLENLTWSPSVTFADNTVRNNRARGSLFSTPRRVVAERNLFDHTSGTAILLCGDCMGWYETGACRDVTIRNNRFINALTSLYQFTEAVISIYPEIHRLQDQKGYFHGGKSYPGIVIEDNTFDTFDAPLLYAKSTDGLIFRRNTITHNADYAPFHHNRFAIKLQHCRSVEITDNSAPSTLSMIVE
ncbi:alpha-1,3-galactosidase-related protein [Paramuribaculum intestinale]|uniref:alpha-1,3-galactosidase-related protein n=1 Tax=Paramuribaculum intestinale TaxID=2094151 RepID=UPI003F68DB81